MVVRDNKSAVKLSVVQPNEIRSLNDVFRCAPYSASLSARACATRRQKALRLSDLTTKDRWMSDRAMIDRNKCVDCPLGAEIESIAAGLIVEGAQSEAEFVVFTEAGIELLCTFASRTDRRAAEERAAILPNTVDRALRSGQMRSKTFKRLCPELFNPR